jgi:hypothetical protein
MNDARQRKLSVLVLTKNYFVDSLRSFGHRVITVGFNKENFELYGEDLQRHTPVGGQSAVLKGFDYFFHNGAAIKEILAVLPADFKPEIVVYHDDSNPVLYVTGLEELEIPTLFYSIDCHIHCERHRIFSGMFDKTLVAQKDYQEPFREYCPDTEWFPLWCRVRAEPSSVKDVEIAFRGGLDVKINPKRVAFFKELSKRFVLDAGPGPFAELYGRAKIVLNQAIQKDLNFRVFEAMACGAMLLTPRIENGQQDLFQPGVHLVEFADDDLEDASGKISYYLEHEQERSRIAEAGREIVLQHHTEERRAREFERKLLSLTVSERPKKHSAAMYHNLLHTKIETFVMRRTEKAQAALLETARSARACARRREDLGSVFLVNFLGCKGLLLAHGFRDEALALAKDVQDAFLAPAYLMIYLGTLQQLGGRAEALEIARGFSAAPEETLEQAAKTLQELEAPVLNQLETEMRLGSQVNPAKLR